MFGCQVDLHLLTGRGTAPDGFHVRQLEAQTINARFQTGLDFASTRRLTFHPAHGVADQFRSGLQVELLLDIQPMDFDRLGAQV